MEKARVLLSCMREALGEGGVGRRGTSREVPQERAKARAIRSSLDSVAIAQNWSAPRIGVPRRGVHRTAKAQKHDGGGQPGSPQR